MRWCASGEGRYPDACGSGGDPVNPAGGLAAWTIALDGYLTRLRAAWGEQPEHELRALLAGVGVAADPSDAERLAFDRAAAGPPDRISAGLQLTSGETLTIAAVWAAETDPQFAVVLGCAHDDPARRYASAALLRLLAQPYGLDLPTAWTSADPRVRWCSRRRPGRCWPGTGVPIKRTGQPSPNGWPACLTGSPHTSTDPGRYCCGARGRQPWPGRSCLPPAGYRLPIRCQYRSCDCLPG